MEATRISRLLDYCIVRRSLCALGLLPVFAVTYLAAYWLRFEGSLAPADTTRVATTIGWVVAMKLAAFAAFRAFQGWSQHATFHDMVTLVKAVTCAALALVVVDFLFLTTTTIPRSIVLLDWGITIVVVGGLRSATRIVQERQLPLVPNRGKTPVLIVGTSGSGEALLRTIRRNPKLPFQVIGFVSRKIRTVGSRIGGIPVLGRLDETAEIANKRQISTVFISADDLSGQEVRRLVEDTEQRQIEVRVLPSSEQLLHGNVALRPRTVSIEDLLRRDPVELDMAQLHHWIDDHVLLVTGSAGSIGSEICRQLLQFQPKKLVLVDRNENGQFFLERELQRLAPGVKIDVRMADITDFQRMNQIFRDAQPDIVFHAAAYKHVPLMEANPGEAVKNIVFATRMLADLAHQQQVSSFVMISTDKAVNPTSVMGACKRISELYVQALATQSSCRFVTVRFGNVLDSAGSVVPIFREQIAAGGPVTVTHPDMCRYFMTIPEASQLVIQAGAMGQGTEIFVLDMGQPVKIVDLATDMIRLSGLLVDEDVSIEFTGLRPGEKMFEELHADGEKHVETSHAKILVAESMPMQLSEVRPRVATLIQAADAQKTLIIEQIRGLVPELARPTADERPWKDAA